MGGGLYHCGGGGSSLSVRGPGAPAVPCRPSSFEAAHHVKCRGLCRWGGLGAVPVVHLEGWELLERSLNRGGRDGAIRVVPRRQARAAFSIKRRAGSE